MKLDLYLAQNELSATAFAAKVGVPPSTITRILTGARTPRLDTIARIAQATNGAVSVADFVGATVCVPVSAPAATIRHEKSAPPVSRRAAL